MTKIFFKPRCEENSSITTSIDSARFIGNSKQSSSICVKKTRIVSNAKKATTEKRAKNCRNRKTYDQMIVLMKYFKQDPDWSRATVQKVKKEIQIKTSQVYKWGYDQKLKLKETQQQSKNGSIIGDANISQKDVFMTDDSIEDYNSAVTRI